MNQKNIQEKFLRVLDLDDDYSQEDFDMEFNQVSVVSNKDYNKIPLTFINKSDNPDPEYATSGSSGFDLRANLDELMIIESGCVGIIPTGLFFNIPDNFEIQIRPRSGLAAKDNVTVLNSPATIDSDYTGEIKVILINHGKFDFRINSGDRIAQAIFSSVWGKSLVNLTKVDEIIKNTERGSGGFGSTGNR